MRAMIEDNSNKYTRYEDYITTFIRYRSIFRSLEIKHAIENQQQDLAISIWTQLILLDLVILTYRFIIQNKEFSIFFKYGNSFSYDFHVMSKINNIGENTILEQFQ